MPLLLHLLFFACYLLVASAVAVLTPRFVDWLVPQTALLAGGGLFVVSILLHLVLTQADRQRRIAAEMAQMRRQTHELAEDLLSTQHQTMQMRNAVEEVGRHGDARVSNVVAEVKVLQGLIESFSRNMTATRSAASAATANAQGRPKLVAVNGGLAEASAPSIVPQGDLDEQHVLEIVREALRLDRVDVYLQPIVSLPQRRKRFYECFTRIRDAEGNVIGPGQYIDIAERAGLVSAIDNMLLFRCVQLIRRSQQRNYDTAFYCNISATTLGDTQFFNDFTDFVAENPDLAPKLHFEFGQADIESAPPEAQHNLARLAELGFRFSLDQVTHFDFNFAALAERDFRFVKVHAERLLNPPEDLLDDIDPRDLRAALDRAGIDMIVERIETDEQLLDLLDYDVDYGQGYLFGEPRLSRLG
jgi:cyclic-di-GMP phosphodiesterase TipF (flagellum assembly factor)